MLLKKHLAVFKAVLLISLFACQASFLHSQQIGTWRSYLSVNDARSLFVQSEEVWVATTGGLVSYSSNEQRIIESIDPVSGLYKSLLPTVVRYSSFEGDKAIIGYQDGMLEIVALEGAGISRVDDIFRSTRYTSKEILDIYSDPNNNGRLWLSTAFGLVAFEQNGRFVATTITRFTEQASNSFPVLTSLSVGNRLFVLRSDGLYTAEYADLDELIVPENWQKLEVVQEMSDQDFQYYDLTLASDKLFMSTSSAVYQIVLSDLSLSEVGPAGLVHLSYDNDSKILAGITSASATSTDGSSAANYVLFGRAGESFEAIETGIETEVTDLTIQDANNVLLTTTDQGLLKVELNASTVRSFTTDGPSSNFFDGLYIDENTDMLISGSTGQPQADGPESPSRGFYLYDTIEDTWKSFNQLNTNELRSLNFKSAFRSISYDGSYFFGSWGRGILRYQLTDGEFEIYRNEEGVIGVSGGNYSVIHGLEKDPEGRLWALSHFSTRPLHYFDSDNNTWISFPAFDATTSADVYRELLIDRNGRKWMTLKAISGSGLVIVDTADPLDPEDDQSIKLTSEPLNGNLPSSTVNALLEDLNGEIWIGTSSGIGRFIFPDFIIEGGRAERTAQWLINADTSADRPFLLPEINVSTMEVDGANQKWIGTSSDGLWVLNEDGSAIVEHFTAENSPILSNSIIDLCFHKSTGEMYIATDKGLMRYTTPTLAADNNPDELSIYPNPLNYRQSTTTNVTIEGLPARSRVKILSVDGILIDEFSATGGRVQWQANNKSGGQLASGIYVIAAIDLSGGKSRTAKLVVIR